ncbi:MAG TPA: lipid-A-disaccharide synthase [Gemmatimonadales bacterium]|nr:lipid-A-disaccharide synthase [Gemmatimonadales bacterium]
MRGRRPIRLLVSAGEPSGDLHGGRVVTALRRRFPDAEIDAVGGPRMAAAGATIIHPIDRLAAFGIVEVLGKLRVHLRLLRRLRGAFGAGRYDLVVLIDYPGFHLRVAEAAKRAGIPVVYYIAPQLWGWWPGRARRFAAAVDRLAVILPFETEFFGRAGLRSEFVGHPLLERDPPPSRGEARERLGVPPGGRVLGIFPGSRREEIRRHWPVFAEAARRLLAEGRCHAAVVAAVPAGEYPDPGPIRIHRGDPSLVHAAADAALAKSGTTTLEAALADLPMVVAYRLSPVTFAVARRLVTTRWISLVNLIAGRAVVPELVQGELTPERLAAAVRPLLDPADPLTVAQRAGLAEVRARLGAGGSGPGPRGAERVAELAAELLGS